MQRQRSKQPTVINHRDRFTVRKESVFYDLLKSQEGRRQERVAQQPKLLVLPKWYGMLD